MLSTSSNFSPIDVLSHHSELKICPPKEKDHPFIKRAFQSTDQLPNEDYDLNPSAKIRQLIKNKGHLVKRETISIKSKGWKIKKVSHFYLVTLIHKQYQKTLGTAFYEFSSQEGNRERHSFRKEKCILWNLSIDTPEQKKGYGTLLLAHVINCMLKKKCSNLTLHSSEGELPFYFKAGMLPKSWLSSKNQIRNLADWQIWNEKSLEEKKEYFTFKAKDKWIEACGESPPYKLYLSLQQINPFTQAFWKALYEKKDYKILLAQELKLNHSDDSYRKRRIKEIAIDSHFLSSPLEEKDMNPNKRTKFERVMIRYPYLLCFEEFPPSPLLSSKWEDDDFFCSIWNNETFQDTSEINTNEAEFFTELEEETVL